jgi:hypothetical protein
MLPAAGAPERVNLAVNAEDRLVAAFDWRPSALNFLGCRSI